MAINEYGLELPADSDEFDPSGDIRGLGDSLAGRTVVPVPNDTARDTLTAIDGLLVNRLDTGKLERYDGTEWKSYPIDTGWEAVPLRGGYEGTSVDHAPRVRRIGDVIYMQGLIKRTDGTNFRVGSVIQVLGLNPNFYPTRTIFMPTTTNDAAAFSRTQVATDGGVYVQPTGGTAYVSVTMTWIV